LKNIGDVVLAQYSGPSRAALDYTLTTKRLVGSAKQPGAGADNWAPLAALVATEEFERVGNFKEVMAWPEYVQFLTNWAANSEWDASFKRVSEVDGRAYLELEERSEIGDFKSVVNSLTVFEFTDAGLIRHIDVYLQMAMLDPDMFKSYDGVELSE
jgi:hypothetical protein